MTDKSFNPTFDDAMHWLLAECEASEPPEIVRQLIIEVLNNPVKLFCWVGDAETTSGAARPNAGLYASDLFVKLLRTVRAFDWKIVSVLLEQALPPKIPTPTAEDRK